MLEMESSADKLNEDALTSAYKKIMLWRVVPSYFIAKRHLNLRQSLEQLKIHLKNLK